MSCSNAGLPSSEPLPRNVTTGEQRLLTTPFSSETYVNPDDPDLGPVSFCSPWDAQARKLGQRPDTQWQQWIRIARPRRRAVIARCGSQATHLLVPQSTIRGVDSSLAGGWTTWGRSPCRRSAREHAYAYEPSTTRTWNWTVPKVNGRTRCIDQTLHTSHTLVAVVNDELHTDQSIEFNTFRLLIARRPN